MGSARMLAGMAAFKKAYNKTMTRHSLFRILIVAPLFGFYFLAQTFFLGQIIGALPLLPKPQGLVTGYFIGAILSSSLIYAVFWEWKAPVRKKVVTIILVQIVTITAGAFGFALTGNG